MPLLRRGWKKSRCCEFAFDVVVVVSVGAIRRPSKSSFCPVLASRRVAQKNVVRTSPKKTSRCRTATKSCSTTSTSCTKSSVSQIEQHRDIWANLSQTRCSSAEVAQSVEHSTGAGSNPGCSIRWKEKIVDKFNTRPPICGRTVNISVRVWKKSQIMCWLTSTLRNQGICLGV